MAKWLSIVLFVFAADVNAQWVEFEACGFRDRLIPKGTIGEKPGVTRTKVAPTIGPYLIWVPAVSMVAGITEKNMTIEDEVPCVWLQVGPTRVIVVGTYAEVTEKLRGE